MYKYDSFKEYIQLNYIDTLKEALEQYIKQNDLILSEDDFIVRKYDKYCITVIRVTTIHYTKNKKDNLEFDVHFKADYSVIDTNSKNELGYHLFEKKTGYFILSMKGSFKNGFSHRKKEEIKKIDEKPENISNTLVPIISYDDMDSYATKFLKEFYPQALIEPTRFDVTQMLLNKGIKVYYAPLGEKIFGKTYFANDTVEIYENEDVSDLFNGNSTRFINVEPGTILINFEAVFNYPIGVYRNTMIHEAIHWFFHSNYFELQQLLDNETKCAICYKGETSYINDEIAWMEWQARSIAPRVLMPKKTSIIKWKEILKELIEEDKDNKFTKSKYYEKALKNFADFFGVTITSARIRLIELGFNEIEGVRNYIDDTYVKTFFFKRGTLKRNQSFVISSSQLAQLLITNIYLQVALQKEKILYINKMLVINNPKYVDNEKYVLTDYGLNHIHECCFIFDIKRFGIDENGVVNKDYYLLSSSSGRIEEKEINQEQFNTILENGIENACHYEKHKKELQIMTLGETIQYHINKARKKNWIHTYEDFAIKSDVDVKKIKQYRYDEVQAKNITRIEIIRMGLALRLSAPYIDDLLEKANLPIAGTLCGDMVIFKTIIYGFQRQGLVAVYKELKKKNLERLLELSDKWVKKFIDK